MSVQCSKARGAVADIEVEVVLDAQATLGEAPTWEATQRALYWIDIRQPALHRYEVANGITRCWHVESDIGAFALLADRSGALVALRNGLYRLSFMTGACHCVVDAPFDPRLFRFNEGACDETGRFWVGAMFDPLTPGAPSQVAPLHSFTFEGGLREEADRSELHNGMAWSPDGHVFYLSHTKEREILAYTFDAASASAREPRIFVSVPADVGVPDGAAVDTEGGYWCALHGGGRLHRYTAGGELDTEIRLPVSQPTMCAFGGESLDTLFVTSARENLTPKQLRQEPHAGAIFALHTGKRGVRRYCTVK